MIAPDEGRRDVAALKAALRKSAKAALAAVTPERRAVASADAAARASAHPAWPGAELVLAFLSMPSEIDTAPVVEAALAAGKRVAVPRIDGGDIAFVELAPDWRAWPRDRWDIPAPPAEAPSIPPAEIAGLATLALVPGLAFDRTGGRLGRGKGYYDRFLASVAAARSAAAARSSGPSSPFVAIGYGYESQIVDSVPTDEHDLPLDGLSLGQA